MAKLFIFGIGGTGARVIKSLTMLLAAGVKVKATEVIPILVDPDRANGDLNRSYDILRLYQALRKPLEFGHNHFFETSLLSLHELATRSQQASLVAADFRASLQGVQNQRFRDFIHYDLLTDAENAPNHDLISLLFSEANLNTKMDVGFKGNPNIGSVVLNQFKDSQEYTVFAQNFSQGDRVFIVGSLFGGTGAAGLPLLLKNIRNADSRVPNHNFLKEAKVGALAMLPYFGVSKSDTSAIDDQTFMTKTKAALAYYGENVNGSLNALYYFGDAETKKYDNAEGSGAQKNDAHFAEVAAAMAIVDFMDLGDEALHTPIFREFGLDTDAQQAVQESFAIRFSSLDSQKTLPLLRRPLMQFWLMEAFFRFKLDESLGKDPWSNAPKKVAITWANLRDYYEQLSGFIEHFREWLAELERNKIPFAPFNREVTLKNLFQFVHGSPVKRSLNPFAKGDEDTFVAALNKSAEGSLGDLPPVQKFAAVFWDGTNRLIREKFEF